MQTVVLRAAESAIAYADGEYLVTSPVHLAHIAVLCFAQDGCRGVASPRLRAQIVDRRLGLSCACLRLTEQDRRPLPVAETTEGSLDVPSNELEDGTHVHQGVASMIVRNERIPLSPTLRTIEARRHCRGRE